MEYAQKSIQIKNDPGYTHRLRLDDIHGIIRMSKNNTKSEYIRITDRSIPIDEHTKWQFHNQRTGYALGNDSKYNFVGSYIDKDKNPYNYNVWKNYIVNRYKLFKQLKGVNSNG